MKNIALKKYLEGFAQNVIKDAKTLVKKRKSTGKLESSLRYDLNETKQGFEVNFYSAGHGSFMEKGVSGTDKRVYYKDIDGKRRQSPHKFKGMVNSAALDKWVVKKISGARGEDGKFIPRKSLRFLIARSMGKYGIPVSKFGSAGPESHKRQGLSFYTIPIRKYLKELPREILSSFKEDLLNNIRTIIANG